MEGASYVPQEDDEDAEARGLEALNQMHEELQEKRRRVEAQQRQACLQVIRQKADEAREQLRRMDEYLAMIEANPNYLPEQHNLPPPLQPNPPPLHPNPPPRHHHLHHHPLASTKST